MAHTTSTLSFRDGFNIKRTFQFPENNFSKYFILVITLAIKVVRL